LRNEGREYKKLRHHYSLHPHDILLASFYYIIYKYGQQQQWQRIEQQHQHIAAYSGMHREKHHESYQQPGHTLCKKQQAIDQPEKFTLAMLYIRHCYYQQQKQCKD
jgi:hypothetical protein